MTLPKHLRPRWRYVAVAVETDGAGLDREAFERTVHEAARALLGDPGAADARLDPIDFERASEEDGTTGEEWRAILRVRHGEVEPARAAVACVGAVDGEPVGVHVLGVSGTLRACRRRYGAEKE